MQEVKTNYGRKGDFKTLPGIKTECAIMDLSFDKENSSIKKMSLLKNIKLHALVTYEEDI